MTRSQGISLKKKHGQHFLRDYNIVHRIVELGKLTPTSSVLEIGCGDGFLTEVILHHSLARLWCFEIDPEWAALVRNTFQDERLSVFTQDFLTVDFAKLEPHKPWTVLANLPYQVTFPILHLLQQHRHLFNHGVIMVQEEVAQKIVKTSRSGYGFISLFFQYYFEWQLLDKIHPNAFLPPPKVFSRLLYFKTKQDVVPIMQEEDFWEFVKACFKQPRRTLRNNLMYTKYRIGKIPEEMLAARAQQMNIEQLLELWVMVREYV